MKKKEIVMLQLQIYPQILDILRVMHRSNPLTTLRHLCIGGVELKMLHIKNNQITMSGLPTFTAPSDGFRCFWVHLRCSMPQYKDVIGTKLIRYVINRLYILAIVYQTIKNLTHFYKGFGMRSKPLWMSNPLGVKGNSQPHF